MNELPVATANVSSDEPISHMIKNSISIAVPDPAIITSIYQGTHHNLFEILGIHNIDGIDYLRVFHPRAAKLSVLLNDEDPGNGSGDSIEMVKVHEYGLFVAQLPQGMESKSYRLRVTQDSANYEYYDPYGYLPILSEQDSYLFAQGTRQKNYQILGANQIIHYGVSGILFALWAPNASRVAVVGDFNDWDDRLHALRLHPNCGVWEIFIPELEFGSHYKFRLSDASGHKLPLKSDPYAFYSQTESQNASIIWQKNNFDWDDGNWMTERFIRQTVSAPISVYEIHLGSFMRTKNNGYLNYRELAHQLVEYILPLGFTHVQLMPIAEFPFDGSWGYQPVSLFAPTSRFGNPDAFKYLVNHLHRNGIGVLLDWVPGHFPADEHGLAKFDGTHLYEHADPRKGYHQDWNTLIYNYGRTEVCNFLIDSAIFWLEEYHIDGLRVDAVASMLYLDYSRKEGEWVTNQYGGNENLQAVEFLQRFNETVYARFPDVMTIAEESTSWPGVTKKTSDGGLGFGFKWNMGWMNDSLEYIKKDPLYRRFHHHQMTFGLLYAFSENFMLPLSHDEVVHGKQSLIEKIPGDEWQKFATLRAYYAFMWTHPGKKLLFMGNEFAQFREWNHQGELGWQDKKQPLNAGVKQLVADLNKLYVNYSALYLKDTQQDGFIWIDANNADESIYSYVRFGEEKQVIVIVCNFTPVVRHNFQLGVPHAGIYRELINTDSSYYGGSNVGNLGEISSIQQSYQGQPHALSMSVPPLSTCILELLPNT